MNKKEKTMTASRAGRVLGVSREQVFKLVRQGKLVRAGYRLRNGHRRTLVTLESVLREKMCGKAKKGWREGGMAIDRAHAAQTRAGRQRIEKRGNFNAGDAHLAKKCPGLAKYGLIPDALDHADPSTIQTVTPCAGVPEAVDHACGFNVLQDCSALDAVKACAEAAVHSKGVAMWFAVLCAACAAVSIFCAVRCCMP